VETTDRLRHIASIPIHILAPGGNLMANEHDPFAGRPQAEAANFLANDLGEEPRVERAVHPGMEGRGPLHPVGPPPPAGLSLSTVLLSGLLAFVLGGAGAWAYLRYADRLPAGMRPGPVAAVVADGAGKAKDEGPTIKDLATQVDDVSTRLERLQTEMKKLPKSAVDQEAIDAKLSGVSDLSKKLQALTERVAALPTKIDDNGRKTAEIAAEVEGLRGRVSTLQSDLTAAKNDIGADNKKPAEAASRPATEPAAAKPDADVSRASDGAANNADKPDNDPLEAAIGQFREKKYQDASDSFSQLTKANPDDARVWYFAALARGFATNDWKGETERLVNEGVAREKAGKPEKSVIDTAFADLSKDTGKDWLAFYRRQAAGNQGANPR
jgi:TolA-binding protein